MGKRLKDCSLSALSKEISSKVCKDLEDEGKQRDIHTLLITYICSPSAHLTSIPQFLLGLQIFDLGLLLMRRFAVNRECPIDQYLQDQLVVYQCLAKGETCFDSAGLKGGPESFDSTQTRNAREAATAMLPAAKYCEGNVCVGAGVVVGDA